MVFTLSANIVIAVNKPIFAYTQVLPNGKITNQDGTKYLVAPNGIIYSGWYIDSSEDWYYFSASDKS